ncbi:MAG: hypothetical protein QXV01_10665 [Candidatus Bathyarchaeia archaeon]
MNGLSELEFEKVVKVRKWLQFANITICLYKVGYNLAPEGQRKLFRLIYQYIANHKNSRWIARQSFAFAPDVAAFTVLSKDLPKIQKAIANILQNPRHLTQSYIPVEKNSLIETVLPFWTIKKKKIWKIKQLEP